MGLFFARGIERFSLPTLTHVALVSEAIAKWLLIKSTGLGRVLVLTVMKDRKQVRV